MATTIVALARELADHLADLGGNARRLRVRDLDKAIRVHLKVAQSIEDPEVGAKTTTRVVGGHVGERRGTYLADCVTLIGRTVSTLETGAMRTETNTPLFEIEAGRPYAYTETFDGEDPVQTNL